MYEWGPWGNGGAWIATRRAKWISFLQNTAAQFVMGPNGEVAGLKMLDQEFRKQSAVRNAEAASGN